MTQPSPQFQRARRPWWWRALRWLALAGEAESFSGWRSAMMAHLAALDPERVVATAGPAAADWRGFLDGAAS